MEVTIRLDKTVRGIDTSFDGKYLAAYDPTVLEPDGSYDGGILEVTEDRAKAMKFSSIQEAYAKYRQPGPPRAVDQFGRVRFPAEWERPLTAWSVWIEDEPL